MDSQREMEVLCIDGPLVGRTYVVALGQSAWPIMHGERTYFYRPDSGDRRYAVCSQAAGVTEQERVSRHLMRHGYSLAEIGTWWGIPQPGLSDRTPLDAWDNDAQADVWHVVRVTYPEV